MLLVLAATATLAVSPVQAQSIEPMAPGAKLEALVADIRAWTGAPVVQIMLRAQNQRYRNLEQTAIDELDKQWRAERKADSQPLIGPAMSNPLSSYLTEVQAQSTGLFSEIFVMDRNGLNVGQSAITSDYWQGDEDKFFVPFGAGVKGMHLGDPEAYAELGTTRQQLSLTIADAESGEPIGAITVEVDLLQFHRRQAL
jgi:hypothetical protein